MKSRYKWLWVSTIEGRDHRNAFNGAMLTLKPEHYDKQIRLEQEEPGATPPSQPRQP